MKIKSLIFILLCTFVHQAATAQIQYMPSTAHRFTVSIGGGVTDLFGDLTTPIMEFAGRANLDYNITPFLSAGIEGQIGTLSSKGVYLDPNRKVGYIKEVTDYNAENINVRLALGQFLTHHIQTGFVRVIDGIYVGTGVGVINSANTPTIIKNPEPNSPLLGYHDNSTTCYIPVNVGINISLPKNFVFNVNIQEGFALGDYVDGYHSAYSQSDDIYAFVSAGFRFNFGQIHVHEDKDDKKDKAK
jgi:hypothetical protein